MNVKWTKTAARDVQYWQKCKPGYIKKIKALLADIQKSPYQGLGKPEALLYELSGLWSRRISREHRLIYEVVDNNIIVYQCRYHYTEN
ncbi:MAG: Txe/YoeB family addiction module toxin [Magnetococcales bacterium]|nr:Txe/YoeB family addiction module toxin [Magnetococcales bacterium]